jgi:hypothetical protein
MRRMSQAAYEAKKQRLKDIQKGWSDRMMQLRRGTYTGHLTYGEMVDYYDAARSKSRRFRGLE